MSIGPSMKEENINATPLQKASHSVKKTISVFFLNPLHYIFYSSLVGIIVGLFFNIVFSFTLYCTVGILGLIEMISLIIKAKKEKEKDNLK